MSEHTDRAREAAADALAAVLVALVALGGLDDLEPPAEALDLALASDEPYRAARARFRELHERLGGHPDFFTIENTVNEMVVVAADVRFRLGSTMTRE